MDNNAEIERAERNKRTCLDQHATAPIVHDLWRRLMPIALEFDRGYGAAASVYTYLLAYVNGDKTNPRYMSAFPSLDKIASDTGIGRNKVTKLTNVLEAVGIVRSTVTYQHSRKVKLYYPQYFSVLTDEEIRANLRAMH